MNSTLRCILTVLPLALALALGACGGGGSSGCSGFAAGVLGSQACQAANDAPTAVVTGPQSVTARSTVALDGTSSRDPEGQSLSYLWKLSSTPSGSLAALSSTSVSKPTFTPDLPGTYVVSLQVNDGRSSSAPATLSITVTRTNTAPLAQAGSNVVALNGSSVTLNGSASQDPDGDLITYNWTVVSRPAGSRAELAGGTTPRPVLVPDVSGLYVIGLVVSDGQLASPQATVSVTSGAANVAPVADAGPAQSAVVGTVVILDGAASTDANGDLLRYTWAVVSKPASSSISLRNTATPRTDFTPDLPGDYVFSLVVTDGRLESVASFVTIKAAQRNAAPVASAGSTQSVLTGATVTLDGTGSSDANQDPLSYRWSVVSRPPLSTASLRDNTIARPQITVDVAGTYVFSLVVSDGQVQSPSATVTVNVSVRNAAPVAVVQPGLSTQTVLIGQSVTLDGGLSTDANGDALTYEWFLISRPANSVAVLGATGSQGLSVKSKVAVLRPDQAGTYVVGLTASDGLLTSDPATATITVSEQNLPPVANAGTSRSVTIGAPVQLDGSASTDPNSDSLSYQWRVIRRPTGSVTTEADLLLAATSPKPLLMPDVAGVYVMSLVVSDGKLNSAPALVTITITPAATGGSGSGN